MTKTEFGLRCLHVFIVVDERKTNGKTNKIETSTENKIHNFYKPARLKRKLVEVTTKILILTF